MTIVIDQNIPADLYNDYLKALEPASVDGRVRTSLPKGLDRTAHQLAINELFRNGKDQFNHLSEPERQNVYQKAQGSGLWYFDYYMKDFMLYFTEHRPSEFEQHYEAIFAPCWLMRYNEYFTKMGSRVLIGQGGVDNRFRLDGYIFLFVKPGTTLDVDNFEIEYTCGEDRQPHREFEYLGEIVNKYVRFTFLLQPCYCPYTLQFGNVGSRSNYQVKIDQYPDCDMPGSIIFDQSRCPGYIPGVDYVRFEAWPFGDVVPGLPCRIINDEDYQQGSQDWVWYDFPFNFYGELGAKYRIEPQLVFWYQGRNWYFDHWQNGDNSPSMVFPFNPGEQWTVYYK